MKRIKDAAGWRKPTKNGGSYISLKVTFEDGHTEWVNIFDNKYKKSEKHPDLKTIDAKVASEAPPQAPPPQNPDEEDFIPF